MARVKMKSGVTRKKLLPLVMVLANKIMKELGFEEKINEAIKWDKERWNISPGGLAKVLVLSTFSDMRILLTHIQDKFENIDMGYLIGKDAETNEINAFNVGRALDRIGEIDHDGLYGTLALSAVQMNAIDIKRTHADTTSVSFYGEYDIENMKLTQEEKEELLKIERGYSKDGRPECKQIMVGQIVNEDGIPLVSKVMDGSTSDIDWNKEAIKYITEMSAKGFTKSIFVADSKLITHGLVTEMISPEKNIKFVSRCPANFEHKLESRMIAKAYEDGEWEDIGQFHKGKNASSYKGVSYTQAVCGGIVRLLVLESSSMVEKAKIALDKAELRLQPLIKVLEKKRFACHADAEKERDQFSISKELKLFDCKYSIEKETKEIWPRGRRKADAKPKTKETYRVCVSEMHRNKDAVTQFLHIESCIVLISNVLENVTNNELLKIYKGQQVVENSFRHLKGPNLASVIYLKNPKRIQALTMLLTFSLLIRAIIQYRLRQGLKTHTENNPKVKIYAGWAGRELKNPTFKLFYEHAIHCCYERESRNEYSFAWPNVETKQMVLPLLEFMNMTIESVLE